MTRAESGRSIGARPSSGGWMCPGDHAWRSSRGRLHGSGTYRKDHQVQDSGWAPQEPGVWGRLRPHRERAPPDGSFAAGLVDHPRWPRRSSSARTATAKATGWSQLSFTLEVLPGDRAREAAKRFAEAHGLRDPLVTAMEQCAKEHTYFVVYGHSKHSVDLSAIHVEELSARPLAPRRDRAPGQAARAQDRRRGRLHRERRAHRRHRRHPQLQGLRRGEGARELQVLRRAQPRRAGRERRSSPSAPRRSAPTPSW